MSSIDNRIVKMELDNSKFTNAANSTMSTLQKLGQSLKLTDGAKGLENISNKVKGVDMSSLSSSVDQVASRFSAMDIVGVTALVNIANQAINTGTSMLKALTIDPIKMGFDEYETKMNAITTIMTNTADKGTTLDQVTAALDDLNVYADKTIYNFAEMTKNIGTFTAAGVGLEDATIAIKGIANLAAGSGSTSAQASTAMYQLSQALASGTVNLQDWNSVVNAGMGGQLFQNKLKEVGLRMGANIDLSQTFRESISSKDGTGWLTSDILLQSLKELAADDSLTLAATQVKTYTQLIDTMKESVQSGWGKSWEYIIGDKAQAAEFFTAISQGFESIVGPMADYRNAALKMWNDTGGRDAFIKGLQNMATAIGRIVGPIYNAFKKIIDPWNGKRLISLSETFKEFTSKMILSESASKNIQKTFEGLFAVVDIGVHIISTIASGFMDIITAIIPASSGLLDMSGSLGGLLVRFRDLIKSSGFFTIIIDTIVFGIKNIIKYIGYGIQGIGDFFKGLFDIDTSNVTKAGQAILDGFSPLTSLGDMLESAYDKMRLVLSDIANFFSSIATKVSGYARDMLESLKSAFGGDTSTIQLINSGILGVIVVYIAKFIKGLKSSAKESSGLMDNIKGILNGVQGCLQGYQNNLNANALIKIASAIGILAVSMVLLASIDPTKLTASLTAMGVLFGEMLIFISTFSKIMKSGAIGGITRASFSMILLSSAILILSSALKKISDIPFTSMVKGLIGVASGMSMLIIASKLINTNSKGMISAGIGLVIFASSLNILASVVSKLGSINTTSMIKGLLGVGTLLTSLSLFMKLTDISGMSIRKTIGILIFAGAMNILAIAVKKLSTIKFSSMGKALIGIGVLLGAISALTNTIGNPKGLISTSVGIAILGGALLIFVNAIEDIAKIPVNSIGKGLLTIVALLGTMSMALKSIPKGIIGQAVAITILGGALLIMGKAVEAFGYMDLNTIAKGILSITTALGIISMAMRSMTGTISGSIALMLMATAILMLTPSIKLLGSMDLLSIGKSLIALAGAFAVVGVAGLLLGPMTPVLVALSGAMVLFGVACIAVGGGVLMFATAVTALAAVGAAGVASLVAVVSSLIGLIPAIASSIAIGFVEILKVVTDNAPIIITAIGVFIKGIINVLVENIPLIAEGLVKLILELIRVIGEYSPQLITTGSNMIITMLTGLLNELAIGVPKIAQSVLSLIVSIINTVANNTVSVVNAMFNFVITIINGLADSMETNSPKVREAVKRLIRVMVNEFINSIGDFFTIGGDIVSGIVKGITGGVGKAVDAVKGLAGKALDAAKNFLGIHSPSREFAKLGKFSSEGMAIGIKKNAGLVSDEAESMGNSALDSMRNAMSAASSILDDDMSSSPVITPVLDLSEIQNGASSINGMIDSAGAIQANVNAVGRISSSLGAASELASNTTNNSSNTSINNTFNITGDNPRSIADEVNKLLQLQMERRKAVWA